MTVFFGNETHSIKIYDREYLHKKLHTKIEKRIKNFLISEPNFLSKQTLQSPRAVGDAVQNLLEENFQKIIGDLLNTDSRVGEYSPSFARRAMADIAFYDADDNYYIVDVKTHRLDTKFNMPNLTSVERLSRFYEDDKNNFVLLKVDYKIENDKFEIKKVIFRPIEYFSWQCLTLGALGWGQIQIANSNIIKLVDNQSRKKWMLAMCDNLFDFYPKEIEKIDARIEYFKKVRKLWEKRK